MRSWLERYLEERRWLYMMKRARRIRRELSFSRRMVFDRELRPHLNGGAIVAYPDAIYHIKPDDFIRALEISTADVATINE